MDTDLMTNGGMFLTGAMLTQIINAAVGWVKARNQKTEATIAGQPVSVTLAPEAATKADIDGLSRKLDAMDGRLTREIELCAKRSECAIRCKAADDCIKDIYEKVNGVRDQGSEMRGLITSMGRQVDSMDKKLDIIMTKGGAR